MSEQIETRTGGSDGALGGVVGLPGGRIESVGDAGAVRSAALGRSQQHLVDVLVVARESDAEQYLPMLAMIQRSCSVRPGVAGAAEVRAAGLEPLLHPDRWEGSFGKVGPNRWVAFTHKSSAYFYFMGSAAKANTERGENLFTLRLTELIETLRPHQLHVASFTRLVRSLVLHAPLLDVCKRYRVTICHPEGTIEPWTPGGEAMWAFLSLFAAMERNEIVARNLVGIVSAASRGGAPFSASSLPLGYRMEGKQVVPDPAMKPVVEQMLVLLADRTLPHAEAAKRIGALGLSRPAITRLHGEDATLADATDAKTTIRSLLKWSELYETGVWELRRSNPLPGLDQIGDIDVERDGPGDHGTLKIPFTWGLPDGGWAPPEVFAALRDRIASDRERAGGGHHHRNRKPLAGVVRWQDETHEWFLDSEGVRYYRLRRRPRQQPVTSEHGVERTRGWRESSAEGELIGSVDAAALHSAIAEAAVAGITDGVQGQLEEGYYVHAAAALNVRPAASTSLRARLDDTIVTEERAHQQAVRSAAYADDDETAQACVAEAQRIAASLRRLRAELDQLDEDNASAAPPPSSIVADAWYVASALANLAKIDDTAPREVGNAIAAVLDDLRVTPASCGERLQVTFSLRLPAEGGVLVLGPISTNVRRRLAAGHRVTSLSKPDKVKRVLALHSNGQNPEQIANAVDDTSARGAIDLVVAELVSLGVPRPNARAMTSPWPDVTRATLFRCVRSLAEHRQPLLDPDRRAVEDHLDKVGIELPDGVDPVWAAHVTAAYLSTQAAWSRWWRRTSSLHIKVLEAVSSHDGQTTLEELGVALGGTVLRRDIVQVVRGGSRGSYVWPALLQEVGPWAYITRWHRPTGDNVVALINCPHCQQPVNRILAVPEIPTALLCDCGRSTSPESPRFPDTYLHVDTSIAARTPWETTASSPTHQRRLAAAAGMAVGDEPITGLRRTRRNRPPITKAAGDEITEAYQAGVPILGPNGVLERFDIGKHQLYTLLRTRDVPRRAPRNASRS